MKLDIIKTMRRNLCRVVGHIWEPSFPNQICSRCKKKENLLWSIGNPTFVGCFPKREDIPVTEKVDPELGDVRWDPELKAMVLYDGKQWIVCK